MTPADHATLIAEARNYADDLNHEGYGNAFERLADAISALVETEPDAPGSFVGDIWFGHPVKSTMGTHR